METNQLTFEHICFKYKGNDNQLFTDLDVTMETGQVVGILGASGSGKTTLTEILLGQLKPTCQQFRILENGKPVTAGSRSWSYVPQQNLLREYLKVSETFDFYADHHRIKKVSVCAVSSTRFAQSFSQTMRSYNMTENSDRLRERPWKLRRRRPLMLAIYLLKRKFLLNLLR